MIQANLCNVRALSAPLPQCNIFPKGGRGRGSFTVKAKASVEGDTLVKEAESVSSKNGTETCSMRGKKIFLHSVCLLS